MGSPLSTCAHADAHEALSAVPEPVYAYQFRDRTASPLVDLLVPDYPEDAGHGSELPYLFPGLFGAPLAPEQQQLSATTVRY